MALFDTLKAALRLREAGFDETKAGAIVSAFAEDIGERLATKVDLLQLEARITERLVHLEERFDERITHSEESLEQRMTIRMGMVATAATGVILAAIGIATGVVVSM